MTGSVKYKEEFCQTAHDLLSEGKSYAAVCAALDISRQCLYDWKDSHPNFKDALENGMQKAQAVWEQMGEDGIKGHYKNFGSAPWIFTMKNRFRDDYKEDKESKPVSEALVEKLFDRLVD